MSLADIRDIFVIVVGALLVIQSVLVMVLLVVLIRVALAVRREVRPLIDAATSTVRSVQGTSVVVGETIVKPLVATSAFLVGARRGTAVLANAVFRRKEAR